MSKIFDARPVIEKALESLNQGNCDLFAEHWIEQEYHLYKAKNVRSQVKNAYQQFNDQKVRNNFNYDILPDYLLWEGNFPSTVKSWIKNKSLQVMLRKWKHGKASRIKPIFLVREGDSFKIKSW